MRAENFIRVETEVSRHRKTIDDVVSSISETAWQTRQKVPLAAIRQQL